MSVNNVIAMNDVIVNDVIAMNSVTVNDVIAMNHVFIVSIHRLNDVVCSECFGKTKRGFLSGIIDFEL